MKNNAYTHIEDLRQDLALFNEATFTAVTSYDYTQEYKMELTAMRDNVLSMFECERKRLTASQPAAPVDSEALETAIVETLSKVLKLNPSGHEATPAAPAPQMHPLEGRFSRKFALLKYSESDFWERIQKAVNENNTLDTLESAVHQAIQHFKKGGDNTPHFVGLLLRRVNDAIAESTGNPTDYTARPLAANGFPIDTIPVLTQAVEAFNQDAAQRATEQPHQD